MNPRHCPKCGARLARDNRGKLCSPCYRKSAQTESISGDWLAEVRMTAEAAANVYSRPLDFASSRHYLSALSDPLDRLCELMGYARPKFEISEGVETDRQSCVGKYTEGEDVKAPSEATRRIKAPPGVRIYRGGRV